MKESDGHISFVIMGIYVDDVIVSNNPTMLKAGKAALCVRFKIEDQDEVHCLLDLPIKRERKSKTLTISQPGYMAKILKRFGMGTLNPCLCTWNLGRSFNRWQNEEMKNPLMFIHTSRQLGF